VQTLERTGTEGLERFYQCASEPTIRHEICEVCRRFVPAPEL
jgi:hypothetical protein